MLLLGLFKDAPLIYNKGKEEKIEYWEKQTPAGIKPATSLVQLLRPALYHWTGLQTLPKFEVIWNIIAFVIKLSL